MHPKIGSIVRIKLENFVTFGDVEMYPGAGLNLVMGPNGTGKSTILSALVIGLGGNLSVIGRATTLAAYVKQGYQKADIEIELLNPPKNVIVKRTFTLTGSYQFEINGEKKSIGDVRELCKKFYIQIDNLCQFLPQDRVQDFAKLNAQDLLLSTERSVSNGDLLETHQILIKLRKDYLKVKDESEKLETQLNTAQQLNDRIQNVVTNIQRQKEIKEVIKIYKIRLRWIIYEKCRQELEGIKNDQKLAQKEVEKYSKQADSAEKDYKSAQSQLTSKTANISKMKHSVLSEVQKLEDLMEQCEEIEQSIKNKKKGILEKKKQVASRDKELSHCKHLVNVMKNEIGQFSSNEEISEKMKILSREKSEYSHKLEDLNSKRSTIVTELNNSVNAEIRLCKNKLAEIENVAERKLYKLKEVHEDTYKATMWLKDNQNIFQAKIYSPMLIEINVKNPDHSIYLENTINKRDLLAFTCENIDDMNLFIKKVKIGMKLKVSAVFSPPGTLKKNIPRFSLESIRKYGFFSYMLHLIDGPEPILAFLCKTYQIHNIPIGTTETDNISDEVPSDISLFFSEDSRYRTIISNYSGEKSTTISQISSRNLLNDNVDKSLEQKFRQRLQLLVKSSDDLRNNISIIETSMRELDEKIECISEESKQLQDQKQKKEYLITKIKIEEMKLNSLQSEKFNIENEQKSFDEFISKMSKTLLSLNKDMQKKFEFLIQKNYEQAADNISERQLEEAVNFKQSVYLQLKDSLQNAEKTLQSVTKAVNNSKIYAKERYNEALALSDNLSPEHNNFPNKSKFNSLPTDIDILQDFIEEQQSAADMLNIGDGNDYQDYIRRREIIESTSKSLESNTASIEDYLKQLNETGKTWKEKIKILIDNIGNNFSRYMGYLQCAGDVTIITPADEHDYDQYGISIKVRFRGAEAIQELNRCTQSGGERAVATAIYLLSLQELTSVPFRCVDEINQGMDPINERRVFELLTKSTDREDTAQYFLLTPKLLPGLTYSPNTRVHCIYSGSVNMNSREYYKNITKT